MRSGSAHGQQVLAAARGCNAGLARAPLLLKCLRFSRKLLFRLKLLDHDLTDADEQKGIVGIVLTKKERTWERKQN